MSYPKVLERSDKDIWSYDDKFKRELREYVHCYYQVMDTRFEMHCHKEFYEISVILDGECMHYIENGSCLAEKGSVFVIPPGIYHGYVPGSTIRIFNILISEEFFDCYKRELAGFSGFELLFEVEPSLRGEMDIDLFLKLSESDFEIFSKDFERLQCYADSSYSGNQVLKNAKTLEILGLFCERICQRKKPSATKKSDVYTLTIIESMEYIRSNISENLSSRMLSEMYNMSESTFIRHFARVVNQTPYEYIANNRVKLAKLLLRDTKKTVSAIARECGFFDGAHFVRCFEKATGTPPSKYREKF